MGQGPEIIVVKRLICAGTPAWGCYSWGGDQVHIDGVTVGEYALVGAGSVVSRDVPAHSVVYGNPARVARTVDDLHCPHDPDGRAYVNGRDRNSRV